MVRRADKGRRDRRASEGSMGVCGGRQGLTFRASRRTNSSETAEYRKLIHFLAGHSLPVMHAWWQMTLRLKTYLGR